MITHILSLGTNVDDDTRQLDDEITAIVLGARYELRRFRERAEILVAILRAIDRFEAVCAQVQGSDSAQPAESGLAELLGVGEVPARAVANMQLLGLAPFQHRRLADEYDQLSAGIADLEIILASPERQHELVGTERGALLAARRPRAPDPSG